MGNLIGGCLGFVGRAIALVLGCLLGITLAGLILLVTYPLSIPDGSTASWLSSIGGAVGLILFACFAPGLRLNTLAGTIFGALLFAASGALCLSLFGLAVGNDLVPGAVLGLLLGALLFRPREPGGWLVRIVALTGCIALGAWVGQLSPWWDLLALGVVGGALLGLSDPWGVAQFSVELISPRGG